MIHRQKGVRRTVGVFPTTHGFGFAIFEGPLRLIDWGVKHIPSREQSDNLKQFDALLTWFEPDLVVLENPAGAGSHKGKRITRLIRAIARQSAIHHVALKCYSRAEILTAFARIGASNKHEIAVEIARLYEELSPLLPEKRKLWTPEDRRMGIFDAAALVLTHFHRSRTKKAA